MTDDPERIDPRYDPAFQRGFAGEVRTRPRGDAAIRRAAAASTAPARIAPAPAGIPEANPVAASRSVTAPPSSDAEAALAVRSEPAAASGAVVIVESSSAREVTRNPFYLAAAALAVLLIVGGAVWLDQGFAAIADDRTATTVGYYAAMAMSFGAPLAIGIGIAIIAGLLFVLGRGWHPRDDERG
jgi:hypothetical protein